MKKNDNNNNNIPIKIVGIEYTKHRNILGLVGIEARRKEKLFRVKLARQWYRKDMSRVPDIIGDMYRRFDWDKTYVNQLVGQHFIAELRKTQKIPLQVFTAKKDIREAKDIGRAKVMDTNEMTHYMVTLRQKQKIEFPPDPPPTIKDLEEQLPKFIEHKTEAGGISYYAPGEEPDNLTKALMAACFAGRKYIRSGTKTLVASKKLKSYHNAATAAGGHDLGSGLAGSHQRLLGRSVHWPGRGTTDTRRYRIR